MNRNKLVMITPHEVEVLLEYWKCEKTRWSDEEPQAIQKAEDALAYWEVVQKGMGG